jgi:hypothetical protein
LEIRHLAIFCTLAVSKGRAREKVIRIKCQHAAVHRIESQRGELDEIQFHESGAGKRAIIIRGNFLKAE